MWEQPGIVVQHDKVVVFCHSWSRTRRFKMANSEQLYIKNEQLHAEPLMQCWDSEFQEILTTEAEV